MTNGTPIVRSMIFIPSIITLAVTLLRLIGELRQWNETLFRRSVGGPGAIVGIAWLAAIFAVYFALKLRKTDQAMQTRGKAIGLSVLALILFIGGTFLLYSSNGSLRFSLMTVLGLLVIIGGIVIMRMAWPAYWNVMMAYAFAARIPVLIVMFLAIRGNWGTHYDAALPNQTFTSTMAKFVELGLIPQVLFWIPYTVVLCGLIGILVASLGKTPAKINVG
jgi:hypothetical protein